MNKEFSQMYENKPCEEANKKDNKYVRLEESYLLLSELVNNQSLISDHSPKKLAKHRY